MVTYWPFSSSGHQLGRNCLDWSVSMWVSWRCSRSFADTRRPFFLQWSHHPGNSVWQSYVRTSPGKKSHLQRPTLEQSPYYAPLSSPNNNSCLTCFFRTCPDVDWRSQVQTFDRGRKTSSTNKQPVPLLWQPRAHNSPVPSKACQTSTASCGNSSSIGKQEHPVTIGVVRLDLTQHHLCKGSCSAVGPSPSFTQHVDIIRIPEEIPQVSALVDFGATSSFID